MIDILACRRCGRQPRIMVGCIDDEIKYNAICERCEKFTPWAETRAGAIFAWNKWQESIPNIVVDRVMNAIKEMEYCNLDHDWLREEVSIIVNEYIGGTEQ